MRPLYLLFIGILIGLSFSASSQRAQIFPGIYRAKMIVPVAKKKGKKPKPKEVFVSIYRLKYTFATSGKKTRQIDFFKYIEYFEGERTRELIFESNMITQNEARTEAGMLHVTKDILNSYKTYTDFEWIKFDQNKKFFADFDREDGQNFINAYYKKIYSIPAGQHYSSKWSEIFDIRDIDFIKKLKIVGVGDKKTIDEFVDLKHHVDEQLKSHIDYTAEASALKRENEYLLNDLGKNILNSSYHSLSVYQFYDENGSSLINARVGKETYYSNKEYDDKTYYVHKYLLLKHYENDKILKEVYLRPIDVNSDIYNPHIFLMEVVKDSLPFVIPYQKLVIDHSGTSKLKIYGLKGSCNKVENLENFYPERSTDVLNLAYVKRERTGELIKKQIYNDRRFEHMILTTELPIRKEKFLIEKEKFQTYSQKEAQDEKLRLLEEKKRDRLAKEKYIKKHGFFLETKELKNSDLVQKIYEGNFDRVLFNRNDLQFTAMIFNYMNYFAKNCSSSLPNNKVQIYRDVCSKERVTRDGYGVEIRRTCVEWTEQGTEYYASPKLYEAYRTIKNINSKEALKNVLSIWTQGMNNRSVSKEMSSLKADMEQIIELNGCNNKALKRFEENLIRFANDQPPMKLDGSIGK
ncbi:MAG: hypothetical protein R8N23_10590 [Reichenbachiella sp.]|uniref:hypothetical protein n=1 Tax=Reichenbachiella sp. TaxID=2184521 RepID=UPI0029673DE1|nr:hypothetical protein [Reichenbachiella sp.]MDW3210306.1 hypothetical protein [Reichenbachiella sp.]